MTDNATLKAFRDFLEKYEKANPDHVKTNTLLILYSALNFLRERIEDPEDKGITWANPFCEVQYPAPWDWDAGALVVPQLKDKEALTLEEFAGAFALKKALFAFNEITHHAYYRKEGEGYTLLVPENEKRELEKLSKKKQAEYINFVRKGFDFLVKTPARPVGVSLRGKTVKVGITLFVTVYPLVVDLEAKRAYYPVQAGLFLTGTHLRELTDEHKRKIWDGILKNLRGNIPEENFDFLKERATGAEAPVIKPIDRTVLVKAGLHTELQKFGSRPRPYQESFFDMLDPDSKKQYTDSGVEVVGVDITIAQNKALHAIQALFSKTDYKGNVPAKRLRKRDNSFSYEGIIPILRFTPSEYLEACGVKKRATARGFYEYNANERLEALRALWELGTKPFLFVYDRQYKKDGKDVFDAIRTVRTLFNIVEGFEALTRAEKDSLTSTPSPGARENLKTLAVELSPLLVDQINSYYILKPANYLQEVKLLVPHASKYVYSFVDWLIAQRRLRYEDPQPTITISAQALAVALRMDAWLKKKQWKQIRGSLNKCYKIAVELGYLLDYKTIQGKTKEVEKFSLNPAKFYKMKEIETERARSTQSYA